MEQAKIRENDSVNERKSRLLVLSRGSDGHFGFHFKGNRVATVIEGSPAELGGMKKGDEIISINGENLELLLTSEVLEILKAIKARGGSQATFVLR